MPDQTASGGGAPLRPAATVLLLRDGAAGLEVFMVKRHHRIDFASGALVFPGGKVDKGDGAAGLEARSQGAADLQAEERSLRIAALREAFEETGILLADPAASPLNASAVAARRAALNDGTTTLAAIAEEFDLTLRLDALTKFAHWITPDMMPKRFDTHFYLAADRDDCVGCHDGGETVDSCWIAPDRALAEAEEGKWTIIFPTRMNLMKLARSATVEEAIARAREEPIVTVQPWIADQDGQAVLRIPADAGYGDVVEPLDNIKA